MKPNILYVFADQLALKALHIYGGRNDIQTPNIDYLAANGVRFTQSYCTTPQCSPSRSSILTGLYPHKTGVLGNTGTPGTADLPHDMHTMGRFFTGKGYDTAYFGKWHLGVTPVEEYGFQYASVNAGISSPSEPPKPADEHADEHTTNCTLEFLDSRKAKPEAPWLAVVSYINPHDIYKAKKMCDGKAPLPVDTVQLPDSITDSLVTKPQAQSEFRDFDQGRNLKEFSEDDWKFYLAYYRQLVEEIDQQLGRLLGKLRAIGQLDRTLVVFTSDHGDMMAAHRLPFKGPVMYDELVKIPLIYSWPERISCGEARDQPTVNVDHFPTICDLLGYAPPAGIDGVSMKDAICSDNAPAREHVVLQYYSKQLWTNPIRTIIRGEYKYSLYLSGEEELYDLRQDSEEMNNLAGTSAMEQRQATLKELLLEWIASEKDPFLSYQNTDHNGEIKKVGE